MDFLSGLLTYYLQAVPPVIHRDIKSSNILLDESMRARVRDSNFLDSMVSYQQHLCSFTFCIVIFLHCSAGVGTFLFLHVAFGAYINYGCAVLTGG